MILHIYQGGVKPHPVRMCSKKCRAIDGESLVSRGYRSGDCGGTGIAGSRKWKQVQGAAATAFHGLQKKTDRCVMTEIMSETGRAQGKDDRAFFDWRYVKGLKESRRHYRLAFILFWSILTTLFVQTYIVSLGIMADESMHPTLAQEGYYLVNRYIYRFATPKRGDIVVFRRTRDASVQDAKRVVGLPGETLQITSGGVYVDGRPLDEPYAVGKTHPNLGPFTIADGNYYVLGDTRWVREDSRDFGPVPLKRIEGKIAPDKLFPFR